MSKGKNNIVGVMVAAAFAGFCLGAGLANHCNHARGEKGTVTVDTVTVRDTVRDDAPKAVDSTVTGEVIRVPMVIPREPSVPKADVRVFSPREMDSIMGTDARNGGKIGVPDTVWATVPRTQKRYEDSTYTAWVSGYEPRLDSIEVYRKTVTIVKREERRAKGKRFSLGLTGGVGYGVFTRKPDVWIGVGCTWRIF